MARIDGIEHARSLNPSYALRGIQVAKERV